MILLQPHGMWWWSKICLQKFTSQVMLHDKSRGKRWVEISLYYKAIKSLKNAIDLHCPTDHLRVPQYKAKHFHHHPQWRSTGGTEFKNRICIVSPALGWTSFSVAALSLSPREAETHRSREFCKYHQPALGDPLKIKPVKDCGLSSKQFTWSKKLLIVVASLAASARLCFVDFPLATLSLRFGSSLSK